MSKLARILPALYFFVDGTIIAFSLLSSFYFYNQTIFPRSTWIFLASLTILWLAISYITKLYKTNLHNGFSKRMQTYLKSYFAFIALTFSLAWIVSVFPLTFSNALISFVIVFLVLDIMANFILINIISIYRRRQKNIKYTLVAGVGDSAARISRYLISNPDYGFKIDGYLSVNGEDCKVNREKVVGTLDDLKKYLNHHSIQEIIIALPYKASKKKKIKNIIHEADFHGARVSYVPDYEGQFGINFKIIHDDDWEAVNVRQLPLDQTFLGFEKRGFDVVFSASVLLLLSPILLAISVLIKLDSPGPVFYCPIRVGRGGKNFSVFKFRTMRENDSPLGGILSTKKDDPRITRLGKILRKSNLDELPQFLNVLLGEMSVVGPRPHRNFLNQQMKEHVDKYMVRHYFRPGITGWAQVNGWRGPTETEEQINQRTIHDLWYIENWSFMLDIKIIWLTIFSQKAARNAF